MLHLIIAMEQDDDLVRAFTCAWSNAVAERMDVLTITIATATTTSANTTTILEERSSPVL
jgi:hypothetical protein